MGLLQVLKDFAAGTSIQGLKYLVDPQLSLAKKVSWALIFIAALIYAGRQLNISVICKLKKIYTDNTCIKNKTENPFSP